MTRQHKYRRLVESVVSTPWAIEEDKLREIVDLLNRRAAGQSLSAEEIQVRIEGDGPGIEAEVVSAAPGIQRTGRTGYFRTSNGTAIIPLDGVMAPKMSLMMQVSGGTSTESFANQIREAAADPKVKAIVIPVDSPGGSAIGLENAAEAVRAAVEQKRVISVATVQMASAAYYVGSAAGEVVAAPDAAVGSIGTISIHRDTSVAEDKAGLKYTVFTSAEYKAAGAEGQPLDAKGRGYRQQIVDDYYSAFVGAVAKNRGVSPTTVMETYGKGKVLIATKALEAGMIDRLAMLSTVLAEVDGVDKPASTNTQEVIAMTRLTTQRLQALGLVPEDATEAEAQTALRAWYLANKNQETPPEDEARILADLPSVAPPKKAIAPPKPDVKTPDQAAAEERHRITEIQSRAETLGISAEMTKLAIDNGMSLEEFSKQAFALAAKKEKPAGRLEAGAAEADKWETVAIDGLSFRQGLTDTEPTDPTARQIANESLVDIAKRCLTVTGRRIIGSPADIAEAAILADQTQQYIQGGLIPSAATDRAIHGAGSFPAVLSNLAGKQLIAREQFKATTFQNWCYRIDDVPDFKPKTLVQMGEFGELPYHPDGDDFEQSSMSEELGWIQAQSYGDSVKFTPKMLVDDDLGAFLDSIGDKQDAHDATLNRLAVGLLIGNVTMMDGNALFDDTNHGNDITSGAAPSTAELNKIRVKFRAMTGIGARRFLNYTVRRLLVPEALETATQQLLQATLQIMPATDATTGVFRGQVDYDVEPMLTANSAAIYYGFADIRRARAIVYCYQRGFRRMRMRRYVENSNNCVVFQCEGRFAVAARSYRGAVRDAGA